MTSTFALSPRILAQALLWGMGVAAVGVAGELPAFARSVTPVLSLPGTTGWDYMAFDSSRLYITHGDHLDVVALGQPARLVGRIDGLSGAHGIALIPGMHRGYISNGLSNSVTVFDTQTLATVATIAIRGRKPDAITFDPASGNVLAFDGDSQDVSVIDPRAGKQIDTIRLPGSPEFAVSDAKGHVYVNLEDKNSLVSIDTLSGKVDATWSLAGCDGPSGLALDNAHHRLFSACENRRMVITDATTGKQVGSVAIGEGSDAAAYDAVHGVAYSSNGRSGDLTAVTLHGTDNYVASTTPTQVSARTMAVDEAQGTVYLVGATMRAVAGQDHPRPVEGSFRVLAVRLTR